MIPVLSVEQLRTAEAEADQLGYPYAQMMQDAGSAVADLAITRAREFYPSGPRFTLLIGAGNNGGDGLVAAKKIREGLPDSQVRCLMLNHRDDDPLVEVAQAVGVFFAYTEDDHDGRVIKQMVGSADLIIDALFGFGVRLPIREAAQKVLRFTRQALNERAAARRPRPLNNPTAGGQIERPPKQWVIAVDCPSGLDCDTGELDKYAINADETVTFIAAKPGLLTFPGAATVGRLYIAPIDFPESVRLEKRSHIGLLDNETVRDMLPTRRVDGHKGTFGWALIVGGSATMPGAIGLSAQAAYHSGAGLVAIASVTSAIQALQTHLLEPVWIELPDNSGFITTPAHETILQRLPTLNSVLLGPGLGNNDTTLAFVQKLLTSARALDPAPAWVIDADGLNILSKITDWSSLLPKNTIITPHAGEMGRLCGLTNTEVQAQRLTLARDKAMAWGCVVVLKGAHTVIAAPDGKIALSPFKTDALAKAGTGDVLAGIITALRAQGVKSFEAACLGVYLHGLAGTLAAERVGASSGVMASDVSAAIPAAWSRLIQG